MEGTIKDRLMKVAFENNYSSLRQMAEACGINYANLVRVSNGKKGDRTLRKIANFFKISYDWLTTGCGMEDDEKFNAIQEEWNAKRGMNVESVVGGADAIQGETGRIIRETKEGSLLQDLTMLFSGITDDAIKYRGIKGLVELQKELEMKNELLGQKDEVIAKQDKEIEFYRGLLIDKKG